MGALGVHRAPPVPDQVPGLQLRHVARVESGSPATGSATIHEQELADLMEDAFSGL